MRVFLCGSRTWTDEAAIQRALEGLPPGPTTIIHGGARGAGQLAGRIAARLGYAVEVHDAVVSRFEFVPQIDVGKEEVWNFKPH